MPSFRCTVSDNAGKVRETIRVANDENEAVRSFAGGTEFLLSIESTGNARAPSKKGRRNTAAVLEFTEMIGMLVESGLSLKDALELAGTMKSDGPLHDLSEKLLNEVRRGVSFAQAVAESDGLFPPIYRGMVAIGDRVGSVEKIFPRLASYLREQKALKEKTMGALAYPVLVLAISLIGTVGIVIFLLPRLETIFNGFGGNAAVRIRDNVRVMNGILITFACVCVLGISIVVTFIVLRARSPSFATAFDRKLLRLPLIGPFLVSFETLNFAFAMETLVSGNVPIEVAIEEAAEVVENRAYRNALTLSRAAVIRGVPISTAFSEHREIPTYVSRWIAVGERSGRSDRVFSQIRTYFQGDVERSTSRFMALIEPSLIVLVGVVILMVVLLLVVPLFSMYGSIL